MSADTQRTGSPRASLGRSPVVDQRPPDLQTVVDQESASERVETPLFQVLSGNPTPEELAALAVVVLGLQTAEPAESNVPAHRTWVRRDQLRVAPQPGPGSWRRSAYR